MTVMTPMEWEGPKLHAKRTYTEADAEYDLCVELSDGYRASRTEVGRVWKAMCSWMHAGLQSFGTFGVEMTGKVKSSQADTCVFRRQHLGKSS